MISVLELSQQTKTSVVILLRVFKQGDLSSHYHVSKHIFVLQICVTARPFYYQSECLSRTRNQQQSYTDSPRRPSVISVFLETLRYQY